MFENLSKFFKKNGVFLLQLSALSLPFLILLAYFATHPMQDDFIQVTDYVEKVDVAKPAEKVSSDNKKTENKPTEPTSQEPSSFEIDEVSQAAIEQNLQNPQALLPENLACKQTANPRVLAKHTGTISKAKNVPPFKSPLPAVITELEYPCVNAKGETQIKSVVTGVAFDTKANTLRCLQSNSDETLDRESRFKLVLKIMAHHCGFELIEHQPKQNVSESSEKLSEIEPLENKNE